MSFERDLNLAIKAARDNANNVWKQAVVQLFAEVVAKTPVNTGAARGSWLMGQNNNGAIGSSELNPAPDMVPDIGGSVLLFSNLDYIERLEDGWSLQAPSGMVRSTVERWPQIVRMLSRG